MPESRPQSESAERPRTVRVLLAEDDDPSRHFLATALQTLGCQVHACADGHTALDSARGNRYDLLLLDCRMPGAGAVQILQNLRADPAAASHASVAIASSAELGADLHRQLRDEGFADTLAKPLTLQALQSSLGCVLDVSVAPVLLDHESARRSSGNAETLTALRGLFLDELKRLREDLDALAQRPTELSERLHPLLASCGFCGASALGKQTLQLKQCLDRDADGTLALRNFTRTLDATVDALIDTRAAD